MTALGTDTAVRETVLTVTGVAAPAAPQPAAPQPAAPQPAAPQPAAPQPAVLVAGTAVPTRDVLPTLARSGPDLRHLVLPAVLLVEFLAGLMAGVVL